jgi:small-conductance mechanosensitive channel
VGPDALELLGLTALVLFAGAAHWYLRRFGRRLAHRTPAHGAARRRLRPERVELGLLVAKLVLWAGVAYALSERLPQIQMSREAALALVVKSVNAPLFTMNQRGYSALHLITLPALLGALWIGVSGVVALVKRQLARLAGGPKGVHESIAILLRLALAFLGAIVIFQAWGLDVSSLTFVASVLGVGLGFGLQNIANNFVSGILIGLERPVQSGDFVRVGEFTGTVKRIGARSTEIETTDRVTILIPNARFLEHEVINWSYENPLSRLHVAVSVAHDSDPTRVREALLDAASRCPDVLRDPRPQVRFVTLGEKALGFELLGWTSQPRGHSRVKSDLHFLIHEALPRHGVELASPDSDVYLRSPEILEAIRAWTQRNFSEEERAQARAPETSRRQPAPGPEPKEPVPMAWNDVSLGALIDRLRGQGGVEICDRRHLLRVHRHCFVGSEAVDWLVANEGLTRGEAVGVGNLLVERDVLHHVLDEHGFRDGHFFYRFRADERAVNGHSVAGDAQLHSASNLSTSPAA